MNKIIVVTKKGFFLKFNARQIRTMGYKAKGVKCINLEENDEIVSVITIKEK